MKNMDLKEKYDSVYREGSQAFFTNTTFSESQLIMDLMDSWDGLDVLEIG